MLDPAIIIGGLVSAITGLSGFIVFLIKYVLADKDRQITELRAECTKQVTEITADRNEWKATALTALKAAETLAEPVAEQVKRPRSGTGDRGRDARG